MRCWGAEVDEQTIGNAGEVSGISFMVDHGGAGTCRQKHIRSELLNNRVHNALYERRALTQRLKQRARIVFTFHDIPSLVLTTQVQRVNLSRCITAPRVTSLTLTPTTDTSARHDPAPPQTG